MAAPQGLINVRPQYQDLLQEFGETNQATGYSNAQLSAILQSINQLSGAIVSQDIKNVEGASAIQGAAVGAATGAQIGGVPGAIIGGVIGLGAGLMSGQEQKRAYERQLRRARENQARQIISGIRQYREGLLAQSSKFKKALASGYFTKQHTQLIGDVAARYGYLSVLGEGITSETGKQLRKAYHAKAEHMIEGAQVAIEEKISNLLYVQQKLREEEKTVDRKKYSDYRPDLTKYNALLRSQYA